MANGTKNGVPTRFTTGIVRLSYAHVWHPRVEDNEKDGADDGKEKYSCSILIPKADQKTIENLNKAIQHALILGQKKGLWGEKLPPNLHFPLRDGDAEADAKGEPYIGHWFLNAKSNSQPRIVDLNRCDILDENEVYSGCYARVVLNLYPFNAENKNKGIACGFEAIQKISDGEHLGNAPVNVDEAFGDLYDDSGDLPFPGEPGYDGPMPANANHPAQQSGHVPPQAPGYPPQAQQGYPGQQPPNYPTGHQAGSILPQQPPGYPPNPQQMPGFPGVIPNHLTAGIAAADQQIGKMMDPTGKNGTAA